MSTSRTRFVAVACILGGAAALLVGGLLWRGTGSEVVALPAATKAQTPLTAQQARLEYVPTSIGARLGENDRPIVTHIAIADLDGDGLPDVLYCDARKNT